MLADSVRVYLSSDGEYRMTGKNWNDDGQEVLFEVDLPVHSDQVTNEERIAQQWNAFRSF